MSESGRHGGGEWSGGLVFPERAGCAGSRDGHDGGSHPCLAPPVGTVKHRVRRHTVRVFVCAAHAVGRTDPRPLTVADRAEPRAPAGAGGCSRSAAAVGAARQRANRSPQRLREAPTERP